MTITSVKVRKIFESEPLKAVVSVTFDNCLAVHDIKVIQTSEHRIIVMPARKTRDGSFMDIVHPTNSDLRSLIENHVINEYDRCISNLQTVQDGSNSGLPTQNQNR